MIQRLVYVSTARGPIGDADIADILGASRLNNRRDRLSGLLIFAGRRFLQVIEGDSVPLARAYQRIVADERHYALVEIERCEVSSRSFPGWEMGFLNRLDDESLAGKVERLTEQLEDPNLRAHLRGFAELHSRAA